MATYRGEVGMRLFLADNAGRVFGVILRSLRRMYLARLGWLLDDFEKLKRLSYGLAGRTLRRRTGSVQAGKHNCRCADGDTNKTEHDAPFHR